MKTKIFNKILLIIGCLAIMLMAFTAVMITSSSRPSRIVYAGINLETHCTQESIEFTQETMAVVNEELATMGVDVMSVLAEQKEYYTEWLKSAELYMKPRIQQRLNAVLDSIDWMTASYSQMDARIAPTNFHIIYTPAVIAMAAGFWARGWRLADELLTHARVNNSYNSDYSPVHGTRVRNVSLFTNTVAFSDNIVGARGFANPGMWSLSNLYEQDLFFGIHEFNYKKSMHSNTHVNIMIRDRYDFDHLTGAVGYGNAMIYEFNNLMYRAQRAGVLTPFFTVINEVVPGRVPVGIRYEGNVAVVIGAQPHVSNVTIPYSIPDIRANVSYDHPLIPVASIAPFAFAWNTSITAVSFPPTLTHIGAQAFYNTRLERVILPHNIQYIGLNAFSNIPTLRLLVHQRPSSQGLPQARGSMQGAAHPEFQAFTRYFACRAAVSNAFGVNFLNAMVVCDMRGYHGPWSFFNAGTISTMLGFESNGFRRFEINNFVSNAPDHVVSFRLYCQDGVLVGSLHGDSSGYFFTTSHRLYHLVLVSNAAGFNGVGLRIQ